MIRQQEINGLSTAAARAMKIDLLRALETGGMTAAAQNLKVTQSAISQQIKLLEMDMGTPLVDRDRRPLSLTPAGRILRNHAAELLLQADQARSEVRELGNGLLQHVTHWSGFKLGGWIGPGNCQRG
jgi:DNA-binding transcriptional LysR family regulator